MLQLCFPVEVVQPLRKGIKEGRPLFGKKMDALVDGGHQDIAGAAGLVNAQEPPEPCAVDQITVYMDQRGLGQCGKRLVKAVDHDIRTQLHGGFGEERMHSEMRSVCLIHDQGNSVPVRGFSNPSHIGYHPVVGRGSQER